MGRIGVPPGVGGFEWAEEADVRELRVGIHIRFVQDRSGGDAGALAEVEHVVPVQTPRPGCHALVQLVVGRHPAGGGRESRALRPRRVSHQTFQRAPLVIGPDRDGHPAVLPGTRVHALGCVSAILVARRTERDAPRAGHHEFAGLLHQVLQLTQIDERTLPGSQPAAQGGQPAKVPVAPLRCPCEEIRSVLRACRRVAPEDRSPTRPSKLPPKPTKSL